MAKAKRRKPKRNTARPDRTCCRAVSPSAPWDTGANGAATARRNDCRGRGRRGSPETGEVIKRTRSGASASQRGGDASSRRASDGPAGRSRRRACSRRGTKDRRPPAINEAKVDALRRRTTGRSWCLSAPCDTPPSPGWSPVVGTIRHARCPRRPAYLVDAGLSQGRALHGQAAQGAGRSGGQVGRLW